VHEWLDERLNKRSNEGSGERLSEWLVENLGERLSELFILRGFVIDWVRGY
jgi:hypothetical protein